MTTTIDIDPAAPWVAPSRRIAIWVLRRVAPWEGLVGAAMRYLFAGAALMQFVLAALAVILVPMLVLGQGSQAGAVAAGVGGLVVLALEIAPWLDERRSMVRRLLSGGRSAAWARLRGGAPRLEGGRALKRSERPGARRARRLGYAAAALAFAAIAAVAATPIGQQVIGQTDDGEPIALWQALAAGAIITLFLLRFLWPRLTAPSADAVLSADPRAPILLLRPFETDGRTLPKVTGGEGLLRELTLETATARFTTLESGLAEVAERYGPFVGIGKPGEMLRPDGAARAYKSDDEWMAYALDLMDRSRVIICIWGVSDWFRWEIEQIVSRGHVDKTVFVFPPTRVAPFAADADDAEEKAAFFDEMGLEPPRGEGVLATIGGAAPWRVVGARRHDHAYMTALLLAMAEFEAREAA